MNWNKFNNYKVIGSETLLITDVYLALSCEQRDRERERVICRVILVDPFRFRENPLTLYNVRVRVRLKVCVKNCLPV